MREIWRFDFVVNYSQVEVGRGCVILWPEFSVMSQLTDGCKVAMYLTYLELRDPDKNMQRFYHVFVTPGLFGDWSVVREWGRIGSPGTVKKDWFDSEAEAVAVADKLCKDKRRKGYRILE